MDWTFDGQEPDFMTFDLGNGDLWNFDVADGPLDFESTDPDTLQVSTLGSNAFSIPLQIDPALISSDMDSQDPLFAPIGKLNERRKQPRTNVFTAGLQTDLSTGSRLIHGQVTPPSSTSSGSPHCAPLDTVDPSAMMPIAEEAVLSTPATSSTSTTTSTSVSNSQSAAPAVAEGALIKPKSKRGRKKKILAPAARDAQRARTLARNRAAAQRCRQRKKVEHAALEARARGLARDRAALHTLVGGLRDELLSLKGQMLRHASCADADSGVAAYVQQQREMLMRGMPEDEAMATSTGMGKDDDEFLRELGIDPKDPMGEAGEDTEFEAEGEAEEDEDEAEDEAETPHIEEAADDGDGDDDSVAQIDMSESEPAVIKSASRRRSDTSNPAESLLEANADNAKAKGKDATEAGVSKKRLRKQPRRTTKARASSK